MKDGGEFCMQQGEQTIFGQVKSAIEVGLELMFVAVHPILYVAQDCFESRLNIERWIIFVSARTRIEYMRKLLAYIPGNG